MKNLLKEMPGDVHSMMGIEIIEIPGIQPEFKKLEMKQFPDNIISA